MGITGTAPSDGNTSWGAWARKLAALIDTNHQTDKTAFATNGTTSNNTAFGTYLTLAKTSYSASTVSGDTDNTGNVLIELPAGDIKVTSIGALLGQETMSGKITGIHFKGQGKGLTRLIFQPASAGDMCQNDYWLNLTFENLSFYAATAGCTFMHSNTTHNAQQMTFINCAWYKWKYAFYLEGNNNNSEFMFLGCSNHFMESAGAFLRIPTSGSDQFLNYWWLGFKHWSTNAPIVDADKGGHFKGFGIDVSDWGGSNSPGGALSAMGYLFYMRGNTHSAGVLNLHMDGLRWEAKSSFSGLLYCEWPDGNILFNGFDMSSQAYSGSGITFGDIIKVIYGNLAGPSIVFQSCFMSGRINLQWGVNGWQKRHRVIFRDCKWYQKALPEDCVVYDTSASSGNILTFPAVEFTGCNPETQLDPFSGQAVWDCTIGFQGDLSQTLVERNHAVRGVYGTPSSQIPKFRLPIGAIVTGIQAISPAGAVTEVDGGTFTLATTDGSPVTIATATITGAMSAGYSVLATPTVPHRCSTAAKAMLTVTPTNVGQDNPYGLLLVKGYW